MTRRARVSTTAFGVLLMLIATLTALPTGAAAEQASQPSSPLAGGLDAGRYHSCALLPSAGLRCWGYGGDGALGYASRITIGDDETPAAAGPVDVGAGRTVTAVSAGAVHTCALLDAGAVRCWGYGGDGALGYGNTASIGDDETPGSVAPVEIGSAGIAAIAAGTVHSCALLGDGTVRCWGFGGEGRLGYGNVDNVGHTPQGKPAALPPVDVGGLRAKAIAAGNGHTCAVLDDGAVRCWGFNLDGRLGYGHTDSVGDNETPGAAGPVKFGPGTTAKAISAGGFHTCALLSDGGVSCWGFGGNGRLGYGNVDNVGRTPQTTPDIIGLVDLGGRGAKAISAGYGHTCAILDDGTVRCWGYGALGRLGYGNSSAVGDDETPGSMEPVNLGPGRTAKAISAGFEHTCALLDDGSVRCWGSASFGQLGYGDGPAIGDTEHPGSVGPVQLGGRAATAISAGQYHTCARLDDGSVRCWGYGAHGRLGLCSQASVGDDEPPASVGPIDLGIPGMIVQGCGGLSSPPARGPPPPDRGRVPRRTRRSWPSRRRSPCAPRR
ncbi:MAG: hypothetical protein KY463_15495 [Actinobacteria bacterium]|nr:hypothetical protein [Actinomycetota bacterium]